MTNKGFEIIVIGGSSGSIPVLKQIINAIPAGFIPAVVIIIHRIKNKESSLTSLLSTTKKITEPEDKEPVKPGMIYLAPQNYHLLVEDYHVFSLDYSEPVHFSRPSIDVTFSSISEIYKERTLGILLSGANKDGAAGLAKIILNKGTAIVQDPLTAEYPAMPESAVKLNNNVNILSTEEIIKTILRLNT